MQSCLTCNSKPHGLGMVSRDTMPVFFVVSKIHKHDENMSRTYTGHCAKTPETENIFLISVKFAVRYVAHDDICRRSFEYFH